MSVLQATGAAPRFADRFARHQRRALRGAHGRGARQRVAAASGARLPQHPADRRPSSPRSARSGSHGVEVGLLYAFIAYVARVVEPLIQITMQFSLLQQSVIAAARVNTLLQEDEPPRVRARRRHRARRVRARRRELRLRPAAAGAARHHAGDSRRRLRRHRRPHRQRQVDAAVAAAALLRAAGRAHRDRRHAAVEQIGDAHFRADVGLVPQEPFLLAASARENIDMGRGLSDATRSPPRRAAPARTTSSRALERATTRRWAKAARGCRRGRSS